MYNYLHGLPFQTNQSSSSDCNCDGQSFDPTAFKLYSESDRFPTFALRLPPMGANPDLTYAAECIRVFSCDGKSQVGSATMEEAGTRLFKDGSSYYLIYEGGVVDGVKMECGKCFRLKIMSFWSEPFWVTDTPQSKVLITFSNKSGIGDVPYQPPLNFTQKIMLDGEICSIDAELFDNSKADANGNMTTTFQRLTKRKKMVIYNAPEFITELIGSIKLHAVYTVTQNNVTYTPIPSRTEITTDIQNCCYSDLTVIMPIRDTRIIGGVCQADTDGVLTEVEIPDDLPDSCDTDDEWTDEPGTERCLKFGDTPPDILPPITPVGTPPVGAPCPPNGFIIESKTLAVNCEMAFEHNGVLYRKKVTKKIADGVCGSTTEIEYIEPCTTDTATHEVSNVNCEGDVIVTPPVGTPPVGTPPVGSPPVGTPPVGSPPVGTPPPTSFPQKYRLIMGTTGGGFDSSAEHGIHNDWVQRIEATMYTWGRGLQGISLWIGWSDYEPTTGNFQAAALQRAIAYCNARQLELHITWLPRRKEGDGFLLADELVKGSGGTIYVEGVPGFGSVYAGYYNDRVNALMVPAIQSIANVLKTYSRAGIMFQGGGHTGEFINHIIVNGGIWESGDFSVKNLADFNAWVTPRGIATAGTPPMIQGSGIPWPHPDFTQPRGVEFGRFMTYALSKHYRNFCNAVRAVAPNMPCVNLYAAADNLQLRATANAAMGYIGQWGNGQYGSEGDGLYDHAAKFRCNSVNLGTFPNGISCIEFDPDDTSVWRYSYGTTPPYGGANPQWAIVKTSMQSLMDKGVQIVLLAMAYHPAELSSEGCSQMLQQLNQSHFGKTYNRPVINSTNRINCEVTIPYRTSQAILDYYDVDANSQYANYTNADYWGGVPPEGGGGTPPVGSPPVGTPPVGTPPALSKPAIDNYLNSNAAAYQNNIVMDVVKPGTGIYSYRRGAYTPDTMLPVASLSKIVSAAVLLTILDDGLFANGINTTVGSLIPSWNTGWQSAITLKQIISHTAGISPDTFESLDGSDTLEDYVDAYAAYPMDYTPGTAFEYS
ncbi:MAG TPA: serine hydrolase domain-containing protein, partial [Candidatus Saccharimonadales bacterium]|nr:serine hydrolase domain-containing protein [Candidatus Saccharimonadales bacterium]